jgi:hypothetical protein
MRLVRNYQTLFDQPQEDGCDLFDWALDSEKTKKPEGDGYVIVCCLYLYKQKKGFIHPKYCCYFERKDPAHYLTKYETALRQAEFAASRRFGGDEQSYHNSDLQKFSTTVYGYRVGKLVHRRSDFTVAPFYEDGRHSMAMGAIETYKQEFRIPELIPPEWKVKPVLHAGLCPDPVGFAVVNYRRDDSPTCFVGVSPCIVSDICKERKDAVERVRSHLRDLKNIRVAGIANPNKEPINTEFEINRRGDLHTQFQDRFALTWDIRSPDGRKKLAVYITAILPVYHIDYILRWVKTAVNIAANTNEKQLDTAVNSPDFDFFYRLSQK